MRSARLIGTLLGLTLLFVSAGFTAWGLAVALDRVLLVIEERTQ